MNVSRIRRRLVVSGVATALAAAGLVGASTTAANAFEGTTTYTCDVLGTPVPMTMTATVPVLPPTANAGMIIPGNLLDVSTALTVSEAVATMLVGAGVTGGTVDDFAMLIGDKGSAPAPLTVTSFAPGDAGALIANAAGKNAG